MRAAVLVFVVACGSSQKPAPDPVPAGPAKDTRTPFEQRRDASCGAAGDRIVKCAVADAKADLDRGVDDKGNKVTKTDYDRDTASGILKELKNQWMKTCGEVGTSFQIRVLEVCVKEEDQCGPFVDCLSHLNDKAR